MLVYINLEHDRLQEDPVRWEKLLARRMRQKYRFEEISGQPCLITRYHRATPALLEEVNAQAVLVSGCGTDFEHYSAESLAGLYAIYRQARLPMLCFCGGHQLLADAFGAKIDAIGPLAADEPDPYNGRFIPGVKQERGFMAVNVCQPHPLFAGLPAQPTVYQAHYWEVKEVPAGFRVLAESDLCPVQAMAHQERPIFSTQFHPEEYDTDHPDGRKILQNFFQLTINN